MPEEFWELDPDADDPENRIRWGRVALVTVVSVASAGAIWSLVFDPHGGEGLVEAGAVALPHPAAGSDSWRAGWESEQAIGFVEAKWRRRCSLCRVGVRGWIW